MRYKTRSRIHCGTSEPLSLLSSNRSFFYVAVMRHQFSSFNPSQTKVSKQSLQIATVIDANQGNSQNARNSCNNQTKYIWAQIQTGFCAPPQQLNATISTCQSTPGRENGISESLDSSDQKYDFLNLNQRHTVSNIREMKDKIVFT